MPGSYFWIDHLVWLLALGSGLLLALLLLVMIVLLLVFFAGVSLPSVGMSRVLLNCPHCGAETPASEPECRFCRRSFREESTVPRPVIDAPKLRWPPGRLTAKAPKAPVCATSEISPFA